MTFDFKVPSSVAEAVNIQKSLRDKLEIRDRLPDLKVIAGVDIGYDYKRNLSKAAAALFKSGEMAPFVTAIALDETPFPYVSGLLSFREIPVLLKLLNILPIRPDLIFVDGQGIAHPRRLGIAAHLGLVTDIPTIGVAKSRLCGRANMPNAVKGSKEKLVDKGEHIGYLLRSRNNVKPLYISPGHRVGAETAAGITEKWLAGYRLPEPTRIADKISKFIS